jgi:isoleucyl-tRNA synthetase
MQSYELADAVRPIFPFIDDASNWYVRRSRRRFWKSGDDEDKNNAYRTLHYVLVQLSMVLAPFTPFLAEELYQKLTGGESVHLLDWPKTGHINELLLAEMARLRDIITDGLSQRAAAGIKVRQPLTKITASATDAELLKKYEEILIEELNVKFVEEIGSKSLEKPIIDIVISPELKREGMMREVIRQVQNGRKNAGLQVDDRIVLSLFTEDAELAKAIDDHKDTIKAETLATQLKAVEGDAESTETAKVDGVELKVQITKAG